MPRFDRQEYLSVKFDAICEEFPGEGESMEGLLASYAEVFAELRQNGYRVIICTDRAGDPEHHDRVKRHLERIGMPYDVIMPGELLSREGFVAAEASDAGDSLSSGCARDED